MYNDQIRKKIKEKSPNISESLLDQLMKKEYYKYDDAAVPFMNIGDTYYYMIDGEMFDVNLKQTNEIGVLPDGTFIIGDGEANPDYPNKSSEERQEIYKSGWLNVSPEYFMIYDVTDKLNDLMKSYKESAYWTSLRIDMLRMDWKRPLLAYAEHFRENGKGDLKTRDDWQNSLFIYNGEIIDKDVPGNILYGYVGNHIGFFDLVISGAASIVQTLTDKKFTLDDERDQKRVKQGIKIYNEKRNEDFKRIIFN